MTRDRGEAWKISRRKGVNAPHLSTCKECGYRIPENIDQAKGLAVPMSDYHTRCARCYWPVAKTHVNAEGLCSTCMDSIERRQYHRKTKREKE